MQNQSAYSIFRSVRTNELMFASFEYSIMLGPALGGGGGGAEILHFIVSHELQ